MSKFINISLIIAVIALLAWIVVKPQPKLTTTNEKEGVSPMPSATTTPTAKKQYTEAKNVTVANKTYTAVLQTTAGDITIELSKETPITTNNFVFLAKDGFYDGVIFHRVIPGFMIQGGDPTGTGMGGPGYKFADEKFSGEYKRGIVAMANSGKDTNGSQFFIMHADYPLPPNYVIFGKTLTGLEVVDKIASTKTGANDRPSEPVSIKSITVTEK